MLAWNCAKQSACENLSVVHQNMFGCLVHYVVWTRGCLLNNWHCICQFSLPGREWGQVKSIQEKFWYECLNSLRDRTWLYEQRQIFSTDKFTSLPTGIASPRHTGREAGKRHGNKEVQSSKRKGEVRELLKIPSSLGLPHRNMML